MRRNTAARRMGYTLAEVVMSTGIGVVLVGTLASAVVISGYALPDRQSVVQVVNDTSLALEQLTTELQYAQVINSYNARMIEFVVADRDADGAAERIRYEWSGTPGAPLTRKENSGAAKNLLSTVQDFALSYDIQSRAETVPGPQVEDATERLLYSFTDARAADTLTLTSLNWVSQIVQPELPVSALQWRPKRVVLKCRQPLLNVAYLRLRNVKSTGEPGGINLGQQVLTSVALLGDVSFTLVSTPTMNVWERLGIVLLPVTIDGFELNGSLTSGWGLLTSTNGGSTWASTGAGSLSCSVYGTIFTPGPDVSVTFQHVRQVSVSLQGGASSTRLQTSVKTLNVPEMVSNQWKLDFSRDPTAEDSNGDGAADSLVADGSAFSASDLVSGRLVVSKDLVTYPSNNWNAVSEVQAGLSSTGTAGSSAYLALNVEKSGSTAAPLVVFLTRQSDGTQTLRLYNNYSVYARTSAGATTLVQPADLFISEIVKPMYLVEGLPGTERDIRLVIDPAADRVILFRGGSHAGTFTYATYPLTSPASSALVGGDSGAEVGHVDIRVQ